MKTLLAFSCFVASSALTGCRMTENTNAPSSSNSITENTQPAADTHNRLITIDMHADTVQRLLDENIDLNLRLPNGHLDVVRMREGKLDAQFFAVWVEPQFYGANGVRAVERADKQIAAVRALAERHPETWTLATSAEDVRRAAREGKLAALIGLEGGYAIDEKLESIEKYYRAGVRYISPTWSVSLSWAGSSGDAVGQTRGLNDFGRSIIREMNRLGIIVDVSHVSDKTFRDIIETSTKPVIATHSGARAITNHPRNLDDDQLRALARTGGVACIVFYPAFIEPGWDAKKLQVDREIASLVDAASANTPGNPSQKRMARDRVREQEYARRLPSVSVARVADHIEHVVRVAGIDAVGLGSDFDGIQAVPRDLASVADFPNLAAELRRRGYSETDIAKIFGGNMLRVMEATGRN